MKGWVDEWNGDSVSMYTEVAETFPGHLHEESYET